MTEEVDLDAIRDCLRAGLPSGLATCGPDGTPHVSFIWRVQYLDSERVATSRQSFNVGLAHLGEQPLSQALVVRPGTGEEFRLDLRYLHTAAEGDGLSQKITDARAVVRRSRLDLAKCASSDAASRFSFEPLRPPNDSSHLLGATGLAR